MMWRIIVSAILLICAEIQPLHVVRLILHISSYLAIGYDILRKAFFGICNRQILDENFLMATASLGAFALALGGRGDYTEAVMVMMLYQTGELLQSLAVGKSRRSIEHLVKLQSEYVNIESEDGLVQTAPDEICVGTVITVLPGERIPLDGVVADGESLLDTSPVTGESIPRDIGRGEDVYSGCINLSGVLRIRVTKEYGDSMAARILDLVENASSQKSRTEKFISHFAAVYTPAVCICALLLAIVPPVFISLFSNAEISYAEWIYRALTFLVVSCPCALVISIPMSFFAGIGRASREGIFVKGSDFLEALAKSRYAVFDKTGTLSRGVFEVRKIYSVTDEKEVMRCACIAQCASTHPIARSIMNYSADFYDGKICEDIREIRGKGVLANSDGNVILAGNKSLMDEFGVKCSAVSEAGTVVYIAENGEYKGAIILCDDVKETSREAVKKLKKQGIRETVMLTGDREDVARSIGSELGIDKVYGELLPEEKLAKLEEILSRRKKGETVIFAGDGINDAPSLARADIGVSMGSAGSDAAIEASDIVLMDDDVMQIPKAIGIAKKCMRIVYQNTVFSIGVKFVCLLFATIGFANMWLAIFADVGVMLLAVGNSLRMMGRTHTEKE